MLPKENRLLSKYDFSRVRRLGSVSRSPFFVLLAAPQKAAGKSRVGFVISTKFDKRASVRNRVKRLLREAVRRSLPKVPPGFDLVFVVRSAIKGKAYEDVCPEVDKVLSKISSSPRGRQGLPL